MSSASKRRSGHLGTTWRVAVVSSCLVIFVVAISVVIYQVRRRERLRRKEEVRIQSREEVGNTDLEGGERTDDSDSDYTDIDDEEPKLKRGLSSSKSKATRSKKHSWISDNSNSGTKIFSHPSQMPPKYYWNYR